MPTEITFDDPDFERTKAAVESIADFMVDTVAHGPPIARGTVNRYFHTEAGAVSAPAGRTYEVAYAENRKRKNGIAKARRSIGGGTVDRLRHIFWTGQISRCFCPRPIEAVHESLIGRMRCLNHAAAGKIGLRPTRLDQLYLYPVSEQLILQRFGQPFDSEFRRVVG